MEAPLLNSRLSLPTRVLCVDDCSDITAAIRMVIDAEPMMECVGCLASADQLLEEVRRLNPSPDVVLLDATMPGKHPLEAIKPLAAEFPLTRTIVYSGHDAPEFIDRVVAAGAWGCVSKHEHPTIVLAAIRAVAAGKVWWPQIR